MKVIHNAQDLNFANLMIKFLCVNKLSFRNCDIRLSNFKMPQWNIMYEEIDESSDGISLDFHSDQHFDFERILYLFQKTVCSRINYSGYGQRMENFPDVDICRRFFSAPPQTGRAFGGDVLVCPIRAGDILDGVHSGYTLIPIDFYKEIFQRVNLTPVFMGQTDAGNPYVDQLRDQFRDVEFVNSLGPLDDFQTIRKSSNILLPVSTFAWLAAWLSNAKRIILPVFGLYNRNQFSDHDLLPVSDQRYDFYQFPVQNAVEVGRIAEAHKDLCGKWFWIDRKRLVRL